MIETLETALTAAERMTQALSALCPAIRLDPRSILDRSDSIDMTSPGRMSPNGSCHLIETRSGWIAVNLPRAEDEELVPAWIGCAPDAPVWPAIEAAARTESASVLVARAAELGLAVAMLGETAPAPPILHALGERDAAIGQRKACILDLSALWAGPLCAAILAEAGHAVLKVESRTRPDPVAASGQPHDARLNGGKERRVIDFSTAHLQALMMEADIIVTSARPRAFAALDLLPERIFALKPGLIWVAITAHGWIGPGANRVGFGDDAAVAGGLVRWRGDEPLFAGDALADPLTGLAAAIAVLEARERGGGVLIDASLARSAAMAARPA